MLEPTETATPGPTFTPSDTPEVTDTPDVTDTETPTPEESPTPTEEPEEPEAIFVSAEFVYDGDGARVKQSIVTDQGEETTYFVGTYYELTGEAVTKYYYAGGQRIAMRTEGNLAFLLGDHLGSTSLTTDGAGNVLAEQRYTAWGEVRFDSGELLTNYTYTGQYTYASDFGLMFYNARWYDAGLGRFAQADSVVPGGMQGMDRYAYVNNNPTRYIDPSGHALCSSLFDNCKNAPWRPEIVKSSPQKPVASRCDGQSLSCRLGGHQDIDPSPKPRVPQVITVGELSVVIMPAGSNSAVDTSEAWESWAYTLGQGSVAADLVEILLLFNGIPLDEDLLALNDTLLESLACYLNGECYVGRPHYTLPEMLIVNQDVILTGGEFLFGLGAKYIPASAGSGVGGPAGAYAGYAKGAALDVGSSAANLIYDVFRNEGVISNQVTIGLRPSFNFINGLVIHKYIIYYPE
jgi:RHS repeat-associated protein